jgi:hypothetical protein
MKYARRSVSAQDIRRYDMFAQVSFVFPSLADLRTELCIVEPPTVAWVWLLQIPRGRCASVEHAASWPRQCRVPRNRRRRSLRMMTFPCSEGLVPKANSCLSLRRVDSLELDVT